MSTTRGRSRYGIVACLLAIFPAGGCDSHRIAEPRRAFAMGGFVDGPPREPRIEVVSPSGPVHASRRQRDKVDCIVRLTPPDGGSLPMFLMAIFRDRKGADAGSYPLEPEKIDGPSYVFRNTIKTPTASGHYTLMIDATYLESPKTTGAVQAPPKDFHTVFKAAEVEVSPR